MIFGDGSYQRIVLDRYKTFKGFIKKVTGNNHSYKSSIISDELVLADFNKICLTPQAKRSINVPNAGGNSVYSEAISIMYFEKVWSARDIILEMEVEYWIDYKMVDYICTINANRIGVSVTRAMGYPSPDFFTHEKAINLLKSKLYGLIVSRNSVDDKHTFYKAVLHIFCQNLRISRILKYVYSTFDIDDFGLDVRFDVTLILTLCEQQEIYDNKTRHRLK